MPKVVISGYYGFKNNGDEAMLYSILHTLKKKIPGLEATVLSKNPLETMKIHQVKAISRYQIGRIIRELGSADLLISGSGGLLQDSTGPNSILYYLGIVFLAKMLGKPVVFYSQGVGPVRTFLGRKMMRLVANRVDLITVRDEESRAELELLQVNRPPLQVTADAALCLQPEEIDLRLGQEILASLNVDLQRPLVGFSVRDWKDCQDYKRIIAKAGDYLAEKGWQILFLPMHYPGDIEISREIAGLMQNPCIVVERELNFREMLSLMQHLQAVVGMRLHFLVFAALLNIPMTGISYDPKVESFLNLVQMPLGGRVENLQEAELLQTIGRMLKDEALLKARLTEKIPQLRQKALQSAELVVKKMNW